MSDPRFTHDDYERELDRQIDRFGTVALISMPGVRDALRGALYADVVAALEERWQEEHDETEGQDVGVPR